MAKALPPQNGAPVRLTVPWKYGFKGIKSIVSIELTRERRQPPGTWRRRTNTASSPTSIRTSITPAGRRLASGLSARRVLDVKRQPTLLFNGYADEVASLYRGMNLRENF